MTVAPDPQFVQGAVTGAGSRRPGGTTGGCALQPASHHGRDQQHRDPPASAAGARAIAASLSRAIMNLLARLKTRPTSQVGSQRQSDRKRDAERIDRCVPVRIVQYSWLSTQVYTPFGRAAGSHELFFNFSQVKAAHFRKVVCQMCHPFGRNG